MNKLQEIEVLLAAAHRENDELLAQAKGRDFTDEEVRDAERITSKIARLESEAAALRGSQPNKRLTSANGPAINTPQAAQPEDKQRIFAANESLADALTTDAGLPAGIKASDLNLARYMRGVATGNWSGAEAEQIVAAAGSGSGTAGGFLVPTALMLPVIDLARNKAVMFQAGAGTLPMQFGDATAIRLTRDAVAYHRDENSSITESDLQFQPIRMRARTLAALVRGSVELVEDAPDEFQRVVNLSMSEAIALELDRVGLVGTGVAEARGLYNDPDTQAISMGTNGAAITDYDDFSNAVQDVAEQNGQATAVIYAPRTAYTLDRLKDSQNQPLIPPQSFQDLARYVSNQVPITQTWGSSTAASCAFVGDFTQCVYGIRTTTQLEVSRAGGNGTSATDSDAFSKLQLLFRAYIRYDFAVIRPKHFCIVKGITV